MLSKSSIDKDILFSIRYSKLYGYRLRILEKSEEGKLKFGNDDIGKHLYKSTKRHLPYPLALPQTLTEK
jgi:hypothetical protein